MSSMKKAAMLNMGGKYTVVLMNLVITAILARLLTPEEYGIVAIVNVFVSFFAILADFGVGNAVVQNQSLNKDDIQNIFSWSLGRAFLLGLLFAFLAVPISWFYSDSVYLKIVPLLAISVVFSTANMVPNALLLKKKNFKLIAMRLVVVCILCAIITITLAYLGASYYALIVNTISSSFLNLIWNMRNSGLKLFKTVGDKKVSVNKVKNFSSNLFKFNVINYFSRNLDNILIGKFMGADMLGYYNKAYQLMIYPTSLLSNVITPVLLPFLSEHQNNKEYIYEKYKQTVKILSLLGVYITVFCYFCSYELVLILFGDAWISTIPCFKILSISIWSQMICSTSGTMFQVLDKTKEQLIRVVLAAGFSMICILIGTAFGDIVYVSMFVAIAYSSHIISMVYFLIHRAFKKSWIGFVKIFLPDMFIAVVLCLIFTILNTVNINNVLYSFVFKMSISGFSCLVLYILTNQLKYFKLLLPMKIQNKIKIKDFFNDKN